MTRQERHRLVCDAVQATGRVRVADLANRMRVSEMTIRRDLSWLEENHYLTRTHGGAVDTQKISFDLFLGEKTTGGSNIPVV